MRAGRRAILVALCAAAVLVAAPTTASAGVVSVPGTVAGMSLKGSNGYKIVIQTPKAGRVQLGAFKGVGSNRALVFAVYTTRGRATPRGLKADFGKLGRISLRFKASATTSATNKASAAKVVPFPDDCKGRPPVLKTGRFEGTIRFRGEQGYTSVSATSAKGYLLRAFKGTCPPGSAERRLPSARASRADGLSFFSTTLAAAAKAGDRTIFLQSTKVEQLPRNQGGETFHLINAGTRERRGRVAIQRGALDAVEPKSLAASPLGVEPITAALDLPDPFAGTGTYVEQAGSPPAWTGDLSMRLPGAGLIPLTGPAFKTVFCQGKDGEKGLSACEDRAAALSKPGNDLLQAAP